ncbi:MAG TPA: hypothetical protein VE131_01120 [Terriglobales bacterium]|nr:hypothetical protein [Terriglobales bacterium]
MEKKILVPLGRGDRIEDIIPYLKTVSQPGMRVVFLMHHRANRLRWLQAYCGIMECGLDQSLALARMTESYSFRTRLQLAEQKVFRNCASLHQLNVKMSAELYQGSLRTALRSYVRNGDVGLILMRPGIGIQMTSLLRKTVAFWSSFKQPLVSPVLLVHPAMRS